MNTASLMVELVWDSNCCFAAGGYGPSASVTGATEEYDGTSWTSGGTLDTARYGAGGSGTQTAGLAFGGDNIQDPRYGTQVKNIMEQVGHQWRSFTYCKTILCRFWNSNSSFSLLDRQYPVLLQLTDRI
jgi:hypothetical protein